MMRWILRFGLLVKFLLEQAAASPQISVVSVVPEQYAPDTQIHHNQILLLTNVTRLVIHCSAQYPVQWQFNGSTSPLQLTVRALRKSGPKLSEPTFTAELNIYRVSSALTGTYRCQSAMNPLKETDVHIYAQEKGYRGQDPILLKYGMTVDISAEDDKSSVQFPCAVWNPSRPVHLYKKSEVTGKYEMQTTDGVSVAFDPKFGFELNLAGLDEPWGKYMCSPGLEKTFDRVYVNLVPKSDYQILPKEDLVEVPKGQPLVLKCSAVGEVSWRILGGPANDSRVDIKSELHPNSFYTHSSTLTFSDLDGADGSKVECRWQKDATRIHKWSYQVVGSHDRKRRGLVKYHSRRLGTDNFACWAKNSKSPDVAFVECRNPMECQIRGQCLQNGNKCDPAYVRLCAGGCTIASIENKTGILQCSGNGVFQQIRQFIGTSGASYYNSVSDFPPEEKLVVEGPHVIKVGSSAEFTCTGSSFLFAGGFRWGLRSHGNSIRVLEPSSSEVVSFEESFLPSGNIEAKAVLRLKSHKISQVSCFAPSWNTTDWESRPHHIFIQE